MDEKLKKLVAEILAIPETSVDTATGAATEPKWDSLRHMNLVFAIEEAYGVRFEDDEIGGLTNVSAIQAALTSKLP